MMEKLHRAVGRDKDLTHIKLVITILEISDWVRNMDTVKWSLSMEMSMREIGRVASSTAGEGTNGKMEQYFKAIFGLTNAKDKELSFIPIIRGLRVTGETMFAINSQFIIRLPINTHKKVSIYHE